ncbi:hypothetical protein ACJMK2_010999 [Sinanodonta woodiana]|uniref:GP-PDE domain-containing protein n=1 Tax=Sinanodonta woodiana TaxID=1069815 RepID=A0ABD3V6R9_SINWO
MIGMMLVAVFGGYFLASAILFKYPTLLHKKKKLKFKPTHISHRGGAGENLENTITAFQHAIDVGTEMLELDCHITADGQVVVSHDNNLDRVCGQAIKVIETEYKALPPIKNCLGVQFKKDALCHSCSQDVKIPLLKDVFQAFPTMPINIDIKMDDDELISKVNELITEYNRENLCIWGSRMEKVKKKLRSVNSNVPLFYSFGGIMKLLLLFYSGLLPFFPIQESSMEIIMPSIVLNEENCPFELNKKQKLLVRIADKLLMRPSLFRHLERRGIQTYLWVLNEDEEFERAFRLGATGVMTDFPSKLKAFLDAHPEYRREEQI